MPFGLQRIAQPDAEKGGMPLQEKKGLFVGHLMRLWFFGYARNALPSCRMIGAFEQGRRVYLFRVSH